MSASTPIHGLHRMISRRLSTRSAIDPAVRPEHQHRQHLEGDQRGRAPCPSRVSVRPASPARSSASTSRPARWPGPRSSVGSSGSRVPRRCGDRRRRGHGGDRGVTTSGAAVGREPRAPGVPQAAREPPHRPSRLDVPRGSPPLRPDARMQREAGRGHFDARRAPVVGVVRAISPPPPTGPRSATAWSG